MVGPWIQHGYYAWSIWKTLKLGLRYVFDKVSKDLQCYCGRRQTDYIDGGAVTTHVKSSSLIPHLSKLQFNFPVYSFIQFQQEINTLKSAQMTRPDRDGLDWDDTGFDSSPVWAREPALDAVAKVCREKLQVEDSETCKVSFFAEGGFNKLYLAQTSSRKVLMRVSLPVYPHHKTRGEVTTLRFLRRTTDIPIPGVVAFDDTGKNKIGFEYILMELLPGASAYKKWRTLNTFQKVALVQRMAEIQAQLARHTFSTIGTLTISDKENSQKEQPGEMVSGFFFWSNHFDYNVPRGPFCSSHDWLVSYIDIIIKDQVIAKEEAED